MPADRACESGRLKALCGQQIVADRLEQRTFPG